MKVFGRYDLASSTTREISRTAGVNEATLPRHFQNKDGLIAAVVRQTIRTQVAQAQPPVIATDNLRAGDGSKYRADSGAIAGQIKKRSPLSAERSRTVFSSWIPRLFWA
ncbi:MAG: helix-turn-helix transcriptional regulator [Undibacterium sp.]|nr:helix-turn-helix transcriptional regulator [Opitutaceae bacterium]